MDFVEFHFKASLEDLYFYVSIKSSCSTASLEGLHIHPFVQKDSIKKHFISFKPAKIFVWP